MSRANPRPTWGKPVPPAEGMTPLGECNFCTAEYWVEKCARELERAGIPGSKACAELLRRNLRHPCPAPLGE